MMFQLPVYTTPVHNIDNEKKRVKGEFNVT